MNERFLKTLLARYSLNVLNKLPEEASLDLLRHPVAPIKLADKHQRSTNHYRECLEQLLAARPKETILGHKNIALLGRILDLPSTATEILQLLALHRLDASMRRLCERVEEHYGRSNVVRIISAITGIASREISLALSAAGALVSSGIICEARYNGYNDLDDFSNLTPMLYELIEDPRLTKAKVIRGLLSEPISSKLAQTDFPQLRPQIDLAIRILRGAYIYKSKGVNILLYGAPGVGKTELAAVLARESQCKIYSVAETSGDGKSDLSGSDRLAQLKIKSQLISRFSKDGIILFDEMEDVIDTGLRFNRHPISKIYLNRLLEQNETPVVWTTNSISEIDPAVLRRMSYIIEVKPQALEVRSRILSSYAAENDFKLPEVDCTAIAQEYSLAPAILTSALSTAKLANGGVDDVRMSLAAVNKAIYGRAVLKRHAADSSFVPELINTTTNLTGLVESLKHSQTKNYSLCLYGPPGTGKTAFARHLAESLGLQISIKRTSDLLSAYLGETEKNIARCFEDAIDQGTVLLFDEVDSLLRSRGVARNSWEVTSVNEMLTHMESHPLPLICTTNLMDIVDEAALRRFTFKLRFDYLTPAQLNEACQRLCGVPMNKYIEQVTLGDIVVVRKRMGLSESGKALDAGDLHRLLGEEVAMKCGGKNKMGF